MKKIIEKAKIEHNLTRQEIVAILKDDSINELLFNSADEVRKKYVGDEVHLRGLIEFSNFCRCNCAYCGIRCENKKIDRYRLSKSEILQSAKNAIDQGFRTIVMQSGEDNYFSAEILSEIISEIKMIEVDFPVAITLSIGERSYKEYKSLKNSGVDRFLLRIETTDEELYKKMHPNMNLENRKKCLYNLKELGFETGTGCLVGLPEQSVESLADDILFFQELDADMIGVGPFIPHKDTPLANAEGRNIILALKVMAITRLLLPDINIPATTAMETLLPNCRILALQSGANVVMPNVTDVDFRKKYEIYPGKVSTDYLAMIEKLTSIGRTVSKECGFRKKL